MYKTKQRNTIAIINTRKARKLHKKGDKNHRIVQSIAVNNICMVINGGQDKASRMEWAEWKRTKPPQEKVNT